MRYFAVLLLWLFAAPVQADPILKEADIIEFFMGRGVCVGTTVDCPPAKPEDRVLDLRVSFDFDSAVLTKAAKENLDQFALALKNPLLAERTFAVNGYTDATGDDDYNLKLSLRRARAVVSYLQASGIDPARLKPEGFGETTPLVTDPYDPQNRRVETRLATE